MKMFGHKTRVLFILLITISFSIVVGQKSGSKEKNSGLSALRFMDIGKNTTPGSCVMTNGDMEVTAGGADIWGRHDEFRFGFRLARGNFEISVQVKGLSKADLYTKAGLMARAGLNDSCEHAFIQVFPDNSPRNKNNGGVEFQYRSSPGKEMKAIYPDPATAGNQFDVTFPDTWIRLKRTGDLFESFVSRDGKEWILYASFTMKIAHELLVGVAVTAHNPAVTAKSVFANWQYKQFFN